MAEAEKSSQVPENLKRFFQRASEAEDRLSSLEAAFAKTCLDSGNEERSDKIRELQSKLEAANAAILSEQKKAQVLEAENSKLQYRIMHLVKAIGEADKELEQFK